MSKSNYIFRHVFAFFLVFYLYYGFFEMRLVIKGWSLNSSVLLLFVTSITCIGIGIVLTVKQRRTNLNVIINVIIPYGIHTMLVYYKSYGSFCEDLLLIMVSSLVTYGFFILSRRIKEGYSYKEIYKRRIVRVVNMGRGLCVGIMCLFLLVITLDTKLTKSTIKATIEATQSENVTEEQEQEMVKTLLYLTDGPWKDLTVQEKVDVLQMIVNMEQINLGIPYAVDIYVTELDDGTKGSYIHELKSFLIDFECAEKESSWSLVDIVCHEMYHAYQHCLVEVYQETKEENKTLCIFRDVERYEKEFEDYRNGEKNFGAYYTQACESDAREYAADRTVMYYKMLEKVLEEVYKE